MSEPTRFCGNDHINLTIHSALPYLSDAGRRAFRRKFQDQMDDEHQFLHTFRELLAGVFVARQGYEPIFEPVIDGLTPDWQFLASDSRPTFIADVVNFHIDREIEAEQDRAFETGWVWGGWMPDNSQRLYQSIRKKAGKYKGLAVANGLPYVVFLYSWFTAAVQPHEVTACLEPEDGLFPEYPTLTGVCHFDEVGPGYHFTYYPNPSATRPVPLTDGTLPYAVSLW